MSGSKNRISKQAATVAFTGLLFALALLLTFVESMLPPVPFLPPGVKLGLSNIVTMYAIFFLGARHGYSVAVLKSLFVLIMRSPTGAFMSVAGGLLSVTVILLLIKYIPKPGLGYMVLSIIGAVSHNIGQLFAARIIMGSSMIFYYLPVIVISGVVMGIATGYILRVVMPALNHLGKSLNKNLL